MSIALIQNGEPGSTTREKLNAAVTFINYFVVPDVAAKIAAGDAADHSTIIQAAIDASYNASGGRVFIPKTATPWNVRNLTHTGDLYILGESHTRYFSSAPSASDLNRQSCFRLVAGATAMFLTPGRIALENMWLHGAGKAATDPPCFASSTSAKITDVRTLRCNIHKFSLGFGEKTDYAGTSLAEECYISYNYQGAGYLVDSKVKGGFVHSNDANGVYLPPGGNDNAIDGVKLEWNTGHGLLVYGARRNVAAMVVSDRNGGDGFRVESSSATQQGELTMAACASRRNGRVSGRNLYLKNPGTFLCTGLITQHGKNDDGSGTDTPAAGVQVDWTSGGVPVNSCVRIRDCDLTGSVTTPFSKSGDAYLTAAAGSFKLLDCLGVADTVI